MLQEYDAVLLKQTTPAIPLRSGTKGTVLMVFPDDPPACEVEFVDDAGNSLGTYTVKATDLCLAEMR
jgi:hypothetical protein